MNKKIYYSPRPDTITYDEDLYIPIKNNKNIFSSESAFSYCPAWKHQTSKTFTAYASSYLHFQIEDRVTVKSDNLNQQEFDNTIILNNGWNVGEQVTIQISNQFSNFFWTYDKNIWISILPHPLTSLNNNFYHCGAWFNLSNWPRIINLGAIVIDENKPVVIKRGDPLYNIKFHTQNQNDTFNLIRSEIDQKKFDKSISKSQFVLNKRHSKDYYYYDGLFESKKESKCPFRFFWNK